MEHCHNSDILNIHAVCKNQAVRDTRFLDQQNMWFRRPGFFARCLAGSKSCSLPSFC